MSDLSWWKNWSSASELCLVAIFFSRQMFGFSAMLVVSYQSSMIIISEFNFSGTHGNNPV
jgi:hypothetical protein